MRTPEEIYAEYKRLDLSFSPSQQEALRWALGDDFERLDRKPLPKGIIYNKAHNVVAQWVNDEEVYHATDWSDYTEEGLIAEYGPDWVELVPKPTSDEPRFSAVKIGNSWGVLDAENPGFWAEYGSEIEDGELAVEGADHMNNSEPSNNYEWTEKPIDTDTSSV